MANRLGYPIAVAAYELKEADGALWIRFDTATPAQALRREPHPLSRPVRREPGPRPWFGISTTGMDVESPRYSTSEDLLTEALAHARDALGCETKLIKLAEVKFKHCEGYYSKAAPACTWPCTLTQMDAEDELEPVYEALVHWADVVLVATPIRWGAASSLYFKMAERMNCVQNQVTLNDVALIQNKVASFIITGGQDNVQGVAGQMLAFFSELGFTFPSSPSSRTAAAGRRRTWKQRPLRANRPGTARRRPRTRDPRRGDRPRTARRGGPGQAHRPRRTKSEWGRVMRSDQHTAVARGQLPDASRLAGRCRRSADW
jgi:multimeric flavodoxin WrbA